MGDISSGALNTTIDKIQVVMKKPEPAKEENPSHASPVLNATIDAKTLTAPFPSGNSVTPKSRGGAFKTSRYVLTPSTKKKSAVSARRHDMNPSQGMKRRLKLNIDIEQ